MIAHLGVEMVICTACRQGKLHSRTTSELGLEMMLVSGGITTATASRDNNKTVIQSAF